MDKDEAIALREGDIVFVNDDYETGLRVKEVDSTNFPEDPVVFFSDGGFWRSSRLERQQ